jgi:hypothetical protein|tara:strand:+ start:21 stop:275 length:255 start_codon:yes stop_codon:yes gene_type:complete
MGWESILKEANRVEGGRNPLPPLEKYHHLSESLQDAITIYKQVQELADEDNLDITTEEIDTLVKQISETMQLVKEKRKLRFLFR